MDHQSGGSTQGRPEDVDSAILRQALDELRGLFYIVDPDGDLYWWNETLTAATGYSHAELATMQIAEMVPDSEVSSVEEAIKEALRTGETQLETELVTADGESRPYELTGSRLSSPQGELIGLVGTGRDITDRVGLREELSQTRSQLTAALGAGSISAWSFSFETNEITGSGGMADVFGVDEERLRAGIPADQLWTAYHPEDQKRIATAIEEAKAACGQFKVTGRVYDDSETVRWIINSGVIECDAGTPKRATGVVTDITEHKEHEQQLERQRDDLQLLNQILRHDVRNELQLVSGYASVLTEEVSKKSDATEYAETIAASAARAIKLTKTARDMADAMLTTDTDTGSVDLKTVLETEIETLRSSYESAVVTVPEPIPAVKVVGNDLLSSVFRNVFINAVEHNDKPVPEVTVETTTEADGVVVEIADNGPGIPDAHKETIFGRGETGLQNPGTGIGLYLVQTVLEQYGGTVRVEDNEPHGSVFVLSLPRVAETVTR